MRMTRLRLSPTVLLALPLVAAACSSGEPPGPPDGAALYRRKGCITCHKDDGRGGPLAPPLRRAAEYWTRETLADYLADPARFVESDARLTSLKTQYNQQMPPAGLGREQLLLLADHVLGLSEGE